MCNNLIKDKMSSRIKYFFIFIIIYSSVYSQEIKWHGFGNIGYIFYGSQQNNLKQETYYEGKLKGDLVFSKNIEAQFYIKGSSADSLVEIQELNVKFSLGKYFDLKIGNAKKPFTYEYMLAEEELTSIERSFVHEQISDIGYTRHSIGIIGYHKYSSEQPEFPFSYYVSMSKDNELTNAIARVSYHVNDLGFGINYNYQRIGGTLDIATHGLSGNISVENKKYKGMLEILFVQDPFKSYGLRLTGVDKKVLTTGLRFFATYLFEMDKQFLKGIEPLILLSYYNPDNEFTRINTVQFLGGVNIYLHKNIRARVNADIRWAKKNILDNYNTNDSRLTLALQMIF